MSNLFYDTSLSDAFETDVLVIGAGLSGLTAAYRLSQKDSSLRVCVIEAKDRVGGRTLTVSLKTARGTDKFDMGGQWISSTQNYIIDLLNELSLQTYPQLDWGYKIGQAGTPKRQKFTSFPIFGSLYCRYELYQFIYKIENMIKSVKLHNPMSCPFAKELDSITMEEFICKHLATRAARDVIRTLIRVTFGTEPCQVSALYFMAYSSGTLGFINQFKSTEEGARELKIKGGAEQVSIELASNLGDSTVLLNNPVMEVNQVDGNVFVVLQSRTVYKCERIIMAIPPNEVQRITFSPQLPFTHRRLMQRFPIGHMTSFVITYNRAFWREKGYSGEILSYGGAKIEHGCDTGPISATYDATTHRGNAAIIGYLTGSSGIQWQQKDAYRRKTAILESLCKFWGPWVFNALDYFEKDWSDEQYVGGCPTHVATPGVISYLNMIRTPFERIHWAGTETATHWCGYMNGAVQSGHRAAIEVLYEMRPQVLTFTDIKEIKQGLLVETTVTPSVPVFYRWKLWIPGLLLGVAFAAYFIHTRYRFNMTSRI